MHSKIFRYFVKAGCVVTLSVGIFFIFDYIHIYSSSLNISNYIDINNAAIVKNDDNEVVANLSTTRSSLNTIPVQCQVFDDGYSRLSSLSDAIYVQGDSLLCAPGSGCRKWFGRCITIDSLRQRVLFKVYNDGDTNQSGLSDAVYVRRPSSSCIPDGTPAGNCRRWFGLPQSQDGRPVTCRLFDDGYTNITSPTRSIYYNSPGKVCMPGEGEGICRKWFGRCEVTSTCTEFTYGSWSECQPDGTQSRSVLSRLPGNCFGGAPITTRSCTYTQQRPRLYVIDGTNSKDTDRNALYQFYARWSGDKVWEDGVDLFATNIDAKYSKIYSKVCRDTQTGAARDIYLLGYSRGAVMMIRLANEVRSNCNARVRFVGIVDAVNTGMNTQRWSITLNPGVPYTVHIRKPGTVFDGVLTTANINGISTVLHSQNITHNQIVCSCLLNNSAWIETLSILLNYAQLAGGSFIQPSITNTNCGNYFIC